MDKNSINLVKSIISEIIGTYFLTLVTTGTIVLFVITHHQLNYIAKTVAPGLTVMAIIYSLGKISGAHLNPAVTFGFAMRNQFPWKYVLWYWIAQLIGATLASISVFLFFGNIRQLGAALPHFGVLPAIAIETILTYLLILVIQGTTTGYKIMGSMVGIAVGGVIALAGLFGAPISDASMNPARSLGPAIVSGNYQTVWIYILAPFLGSTLASITTRFLMGNASQREKKAAEGSENV